MAGFGIRFIFCNIAICLLVCLFLLAKRALRGCLTSRMQFNLWYALLGALAVPFLPIRPAGFSPFFIWLGKFNYAAPLPATAKTQSGAGWQAPGPVIHLDDFTQYVDSGTPPVAGCFFCGIWLAGILAMLFFLFRSKKRLDILKKSALPLQDANIRALYNRCLRKLDIKKDIPIYCTAFLHAPAITGLFTPRIYLPLHLACDFHAADIRFMLLHELQHYKHKDAVANCLMNLFSVLYWFHPLVRYALKEMRTDREIACDASVLKLLTENEYAAYGNTLINLAEKNASAPSPFAAGISGTMKQMQKRIAHIASYQNHTGRANRSGQSGCTYGGGQSEYANGSGQSGCIHATERKKLFTNKKELAACAAITATLWGLAPLLSTCAADVDVYQWDVSSKKVVEIDASAYFQGYAGSFVLYDLTKDAWHVYDKNRATLRVSPASTYKLYSALLGLEAGIITPEQSRLPWDGTDYPIKSWNADQNLDSAMRSSVNWYFQEIDRRLGMPAIYKYVKRIGYGNQALSSSVRADTSSYWMQSSLKISPVEQVEQLAALYRNEYGFATEHIAAVKEAICLFSSKNGPKGARFYGKTGTGCVDGKDVNGWFIGFFETGGRTCFFATNIQGEAGATGSEAAEITKRLLPGMGYYSFAKGLSINKF